MDFGKAIRDIREEKGITHRELAERLQVSYGAIGHYEKSKSPRKSTVIKVAKALGVSYEDVRKRAIDLERTRSLETYETGEKAIPFYETDAFATISPSMQGAIPMTPKTFHYIPYLADAEMSIMVTGHSMKGKIDHGDHVAIKRIYDKERIIYGECYYVVTRSNNLKTVKYIKEHEDKSLLWLIPYNIEQFSPQTIEKEDILELYQVKALLRPF